MILIIEDYGALTMLVFNQVQFGTALWILLLSVFATLSVSFVNFAMVIFGVAEILVL